MTTPQLDHHHRRDHHYYYLQLQRPLQNQLEGEARPNQTANSDSDWDDWDNDWDDCEELFVMDKFARSLKSPPYLSPRLRPSMPSRTLSSSSDKNAAAGGGPGVLVDDFGDLLLLSGRNTPNLPGSGAREREREREREPTADGYFGSEAGDEAGDEAGSAGRRWGGRTGVWDDHDATPATSPGAGPSGASPSRASSSSRPRRSRPIAIELPKVKRFNTSSVRTPPEPLSARGDLPGGYFPLHEDPSARIHRPHPFHYDHKMTRHQHSSLVADSGPMLPERGGGTATSYPAPDFPLAQSAHTTPVTSYLPSGFHDTPLPMGKYYPSNWEQRNKNNANQTNKATNKPGQSILRPSVSGALSSTTKSDSQVPLRHPDGSIRGTVESEVRRRLLQYQRDMMTQASLAASEIKTTPAAGIRSRPSGLNLDRLPVPEMRFNTTTPHKPRTPNLLPLGSPGPVTPMDLESTGEDYLDRPEAPTSDGLMAPAIQLATHST